MFLLGLSSSFIPYLLLSMATLICYMHDHQASSEEVATTISTSLTETSETFALAEARQQTQQAVELVQTSEAPYPYNEISASTVPYTGLPVSIIPSLHGLRAPPGIKAIHS